MGRSAIVWTDYMRYRVRLRGFDLAETEQVVRHSSERYLDAVTGRRIAVGRVGQRLVVVPYDQDGSVLTPVTIHATSRQQINVRVKSGRFTNE